MKSGKKNHHRFLTSIDTPALVKAQVLCGMSQEIRQIREHPNFPPFLRTLISNKCERLWTIVKPLMHKPTSMDWDDLKILLHEAYSVAGDMFSVPYEWRFDFATNGTTYCASMINRDPYVHGDEEELARRIMYIKLGFTPAVHFRDNTGGIVTTGQITRQQVLLKS